MSTSTGNFGAVHAELHLRQVCVVTTMHSLNKPEVLVTRAMEKSEAEGRLTDEATRNHLRDQLIALAAWIHQTALTQIPDAFRDSFLHRNPVNRTLLTADSRQR